MPKKAKKNEEDEVKMDDKAFYIIAYLIPLLTGLLVLFINGGKDKRLGMHAFQAILIGVLFIVIWIVLGLIPFLGLLTSLITLLIWLYGLYVGFEGYSGRDVVIPTITDYARRYSGYKQK